MKLQSACQFVLSLYFVLLTVREAGGTFIPGRCLCPQTQGSVQGPLKDLKVVLRDPNCDKDTVIVFLKRDDSAAVCLNPEAPVGQQLIRCWKRATKLNRDVKLCLRRRRKKGQKRTQQKTDMVQPRSAPTSYSKTPARARGLQTHRQRSPQLRKRGRGKGRRSRMNRE